MYVISNLMNFSYFIHTYLLYMKFAIDILSFLLELWLVRHDWFYE